MNLTQAIRLIVIKIQALDCPAGVQVSEILDAQYFMTKRNLFVHGVKAATLVVQENGSYVNFYNDFDPDLVEKLILKIAERIELRIEDTKNALAKILEEME